MSNKRPEPIPNAEEIIEKFGGIRPMASKVGVAVTTIQGWKKRDAIPANRKDAIIAAAAEHDIDVSAYFPDAAPAPKVEDEPEKPVETPAEDAVTVEAKPEPVEEKTAPEAVKVEEVVEAKPEPVQEEQPEKVEVAEKPDEFAAKQAAPNNDAFTEIVVETERKAVTKSVLIAITIVIILFTAIVALLWPKYEEYDAHGNRLSSLEGEVGALKKEQSTFKGLVPENWSEQLENLKAQVSSTKKMAQDTMQAAEAASKNFIKDPDIEHRVEQLQGYVSEIAGSEAFFGLMAKYDQMRKTVMGQQTLNDSAEELVAIFTGLNEKEGAAEDDAYVNKVLASARGQSAALGATFEGVPQSELKAAAMLFALTQMRETLNRPETSFDSDLALLMGMVGEDEVELRAALEKLAPHSKSGLLSTKGLGEEFKTLSGEVIAASLSGEDVSFSEKASARMNEILQVEKDGELVTGTETQATVKKAENMIESGQWAEAVTHLKKNLNSKEIAPLKPWINKVEGALTSYKVKKLINQAIDLNVGTGYLGGSQILKEGGSE